MAENLEAKSINGRLHDEGYYVLNIIDDIDLGEILPDYLSPKSEENYSDLRIVPGEFALEGSGWSFQEQDLPFHIIYAKYTKGKETLVYAHAFELLHESGKVDILPTLEGIR